MAGPLGSAPGIVVGVGVGTAAAAAIEPAIELPRQDAWAGNANRLLDPQVMARLVAQGGIDLGTAQTDARREGYGADKLNALVYLAQTVPGFAEAMELYRRHPDTFLDLWHHALTKAGLDQRYVAFLDELRDDRLSPPVVALAIVRGILKDPGFLPVGPPTLTGKVKAFPTSTLDPLVEARAFGFNRDRLFVQTAISGRPMGPESAAAATFKGIIDRVDFDRAISEGDVRNEWAQAIFENSRPIPHPLDYVQAHLRGWLPNVADMHKGAQRSGMQDADTDLLFLIHGRPPSWHQVWIGLQRGGTYDGPLTGIDPAFLKALRESDLRPEWYNLLWHSRFSYPSPFVLRQLTTSGAISEADAEQVLHFEGYEPGFAKKIAQAWAGTTSGAKADPHVVKAQNSLYTALHKSYVNRESGAAQVTPGLTALGVPAASQTQILNLWDVERNLIHAQLSPKEIKKAVNDRVINPATGQPWTDAEGIAALMARGYTQADAQVLLAE